MADRITILKSVDILSVLDNEELNQLYSLMKNVKSGKDTVLFNQGDTGNEMFIILSGSISISVKTTDGGMVEVAVLGEGQFLGEMSIFDNAPRSATCIVKDDTELLSFGKDDFFGLMNNYPETAIKILYRMLNTTIERLNSTGSFLSDMVKWGEKARRRAVTDEFTGLYNRRFLDDSLEDIFAKSSLASEPMSLVMADLDNFGKLNKEYGEAAGDSIILSASEVFKSVFRENDILARYGGDEFTFILPQTPPETALKLCEAAALNLRKIDTLRNKPGTVKKITSSIGIASFPDHADSPGRLMEMADKAVYTAKEWGKDKAIVYSSEGRINKTKIATVAGKNRIVSGIAETIDTGENFLILGHKDPDEDCAASIIAFSLLLVKFNKKVSVYVKTGFQKRFNFLFKIGKYNSINFIESDADAEDFYSAVIAVDTPKPSMIEMGNKIELLLKDNRIRKIEFDHHLGSDSGYIGDKEYSLVDEASSACELIGYFALKLIKRRELLLKYRIKDLFTRNFVLAVITGIISDSKMGKYLKSNREKWFYRYFSSLFNELLFNKTESGSGNFSTMEDVFNELEKLSEEEDRCYEYISGKIRTSPYIHYILLDKNDMDYLYSEFSNEIIVTVARYAADLLAERSGFLSLIIYYDNPDKSELIQFRMRRNKDYRILDLRRVIEKLSIENGGGHPGAVGFRIPSEEIPDINEFKNKLIEVTEEIIKAAE